MLSQHLSKKLVWNKRAYIMFNIYQSSKWFLFDFDSLLFLFGYSFLIMKEIDASISGYYNSWLTY